MKILELVNKFPNSTTFIPYEIEIAVFVKVSIDNLNEFSKLKSSNRRIPHNVNTLIKKEIKI
tara:strand:- start:93 stop:278 length:186 start_codon:yes stop_codon:yes gene_type:complete